MTWFCQGCGASFRDDPTSAPVSECVECGGRSWSSERPAIVMNALPPLHRGGYSGEEQQ